MNALLNPHQKHTPATPKRQQQGAAALVVTLVLFFVMALVAAFAGRGLIVEQRASTNQYRAAQAFEAAEAGAEWAQAMLNNPQRVGANCLPDASAAASTFRQRYLSYQAVSASQVPVSWLNAGQSVPLQAACVRQAEGWNCSCPASGNPLLQPAPQATAPAAALPAFSVMFLAGDAPGIIRLVATGCTSLGGACLPGSGVAPEATARIQVDLGLVPGLAALPSAALTARGSIDTGGATLGAHNPDPASGGITLHAGATINAAGLRLSTVAGGSAALSVMDGDADLQRLSPDQLFATYFGLDKRSRAMQDVVHRFVCRDSCGGDLAEAVAANADRTLIHISGNLRLDGPLSLGTPERPVLLVVDGDVQLTGAVALHGVLYAANARWDQTTAGAWVRGAVITEGSYQGNGSPDFHYDAAVLALLKGNTGSFTRVPGSWRDF